MTEQFNTSTDQGVVFPRLDNGKRSTTATGRQIVANALRAADAQLGEKASTEADWRKRYRRYFEDMTALSISSPQHSLTIAKAGLASLYEQFEFERKGHRAPLAQAMSEPGEVGFDTGIVEGSGQVRPLKVNYQGKALSGTDLEAEVSSWVARGIIEEGHAQAVLRVANAPDATEQLPAVVMLGAGAEMAPYTTLLELGATLVAVDLDRPEIWTRLIDIARASAGTLIFPLTQAQTPQMSDTQLAELAGANLLTRTPQIASWLLGLDRPLVIGSYAYLDGADFMRVSVAMDAIMQAVAQHAQHPVHLNFLLTPTDVYAVPGDVADAAQANYARPGLLHTLATWVHLITRGRLFAPNLRREVADERQQRFGIINNLLVQQGPNYTLAKRIQRWRSVVARSEGHVVSSNVAPATYTTSVTHNKVFAAGYAGAENFGAQIFATDTTKALMAAQLIDDLTRDDAFSHPTTPMHNHEELFMRGANHSGLWRMAYQLGSVIEFAVVVGSIRRLLGRPG